MKLITSVVFIFYTAIAAGQDKIVVQKKDSLQLIALEYAWLKAEFALDTMFLSTLMDNNFIGIGTDHNTNKQQELIEMYNNISQRLKDSIIIDSFKFENIVIKFHGNTALITLIVHSYGKNKLLPRERTTKFFDVWIKRGNKWKAVSSAKL